MPKRRSQLELSVGKLISSIQKEWGKELGTPVALQSEEVMSRGHDLLQAAKTSSILETLAGQSISQYLGSEWVRNHSNVESSIAALESELG